MNAAIARPEALLLLFVLIFSALAFGAVEPWSLAVIQCTAFAALALALRRRSHGGRMRLPEVPGALPLLLFLLFLLLQVLPLPPALLVRVSPAAHQRWAAALDGATALPWVPVSLDPLATLRELLRFAACAAVYVLAVLLLTRRERLRTFSSALALLVALLAFEALLQSLIAPRRLLFVRDSPSLRSFGPFVNRNHYADLMVMLVPIVLGLFLGRGRTAAGQTSLRPRLAELLGGRESSIRLLLGFSALLGVASLLLCLSRGATVAAGAALLVLAVCLLARRIGSRQAIAAALLAAAVAIFVGWFGWDRIADRFADLRDNPETVDAVRAGLWRDALRMSGDFRLTGAGAGSFERLYPAYRSVPGPQDMAHAHSDHLELLACGGLAGLALYVWFVAAALTAAARACRRRSDPAALSLAYGALAGSVGFLAHGATDFSLSIGANAVFFFFLLGLAVSAAHTRPERETLLPPRQLPGWLAGVATALAAAVVLFHAADLTARHAWATAADETRRSEALTVPHEAVGRLLELASRLQPLEAAYPAARARLAQRKGDLAAAQELTRRALCLLPVDASTLALAATLLAARGDGDGARRMFAAAVAADPRSAGHREAFGAWLLSRGERDSGLEQLRQALALAPARAPVVISLLVLGGLDDAAAAAAFPPDPQALLAFGRYLRTTGNFPLATETYHRILKIDTGNDEAAAALRSFEARR